MELNYRRGLDALIERAWALHDGLLDEIEKSSYSFCRFCSERAEMETTILQEKERLIAVRDSLKEVADMLMLLQRTRSWQMIDRHAALDRLEDSRLALLEKVTQYQGRPLAAVNEVNACFSNGITAIQHWNSNARNEKMKTEAKPKSTESRNVRNEKRRRTVFLVCWIGMLFETCKWHKALGLAAKLVLISTGISSTVRCYHARHQQHYRSPERKVLSISVPKHAQPEHSPALLLSSSLDVSHGRG